MHSSPTCSDGVEEGGGGKTGWEETAIGVFCLD